MSQVRLNKFIADSGLSSRRKAEEFITTGRVSVNSKIIMDLAFKVDPEKDIIEVDGEKIRQKENYYYLLNKPKGYITTTADEKDRRTVVDLIATKEKIYPVGRLDYNTTGVLLLTNDGDFSFILTHPRNKVPKEYEVKLDRPLMKEDEEKLMKGIYLIDGKGFFNKIYYPKKGDRKTVIVTAVEGRNHFVKRMFGSLSYTVKGLNRISFAGIKADIPVGASRKLDLTEVNKLFDKYGS
jgi:23S rRNA pseudouridine2605 synthase